jgi:hypothetical protein
MWRLAVLFVRLVAVLGGKCILTDAKIEPVECSEDVARLFLCVSGFNELMEIVILTDTICTFFSSGLVSCR